MPDIVGDLTLSDEDMHPVESDQQFNESMLVTFFDRQEDTGALLRIGNRPNEGYAEVTFCVFPPRRGALFQYVRAPITTNARFDAGGMRFTVTASGETMEISYIGNVALLSEPKRLADPGQAFKEAPRVDVQMEVVLQALSPMYGARSGSIGGHYEQHMSMNGYCSMDGEIRRIGGMGNRDHSWGPRNWHSTFLDWTLWCTFSANLAFAVALTWTSADAEPDVMGTVFKDGVVRVIVGGTVNATFEENGLYHKAMEIELRDDMGGVYTIAGRVVRFIPFRHRRIEATTHIGQGMTEFTLGDDVAYGLSEYMTGVSRTHDASA